MLNFADFKELEKAYVCTSEEKIFAKKLENIAEFIDKEKCFNKGIEFFSKVNDQIAENPYCYRYIGNIYRLQGEYEKSLQHLQKAIIMLEGKALRFEVLYNLGMLYREHNKLIEAKECFEEIIRAYPQSTMVHHSLSCLLLYEGRLHEGWQQHYWRILLDKKMQKLKDFFQLSEWKNKAESRILILPEQGVGDKIMFAAFFSSLPKSKQYTVIVSTRLVSIFKRSFPALNIVEGTQRNLGQLKKQGFDAYCFMGCLSRILKKPTPDNLVFLKAKPYLWENTHPKKLRVGLSWRGGTGVEREKRSIDLKLWLPILKVQDVNFVNLQYDAEELETESLQSHGITIYSDERVNALEDMDAFASLVSSCDIVITVDNSTAHLAGALGIPTWLLLSNAPNWRWKNNGDKSYWYQSVRLFRQSDECCWECVIKQVAATLIESTKM
jgi:tetratricopeptide (TPR) repeat protein